MAETKEDWIEWAEPCDVSVNATGIELIRMPVSTAITLQKINAASAGCSYVSDEEALHDFITVHWATIVKGDTVAKV